MKKVLLVSALVLVIATSMVSGTLAVYTHKIDIGNAGSVMAKNFILTDGDTQDFEENVLIAPNEYQEFTFNVSNHDTATNTTAEVKMNLSIDIVLANGVDPDGVDQTAIPPLTVVVKDANGDPLSTTGSIDPATGIGTLTFYDALTDIDATGPNPGETKTYTVEITWEDSGDDYGYASHAFGTALTVSVTGTQQ